MSAVAKRWVPDLSRRQFDILNSKKRILLVSGPRKTGKTIGIGHKAIRHGWDTRDARVAVFVMYTKTGLNGGVWTDLTRICLPQWLASGMVGETGQPIEITTISPDGTPGDKTDPKTRSVYFRLRNRYGGESEFRLYSLDNENEIAQVFKGTRFSMIWFSELSNFKDPEVLNKSVLQLRCPWLKFEEHQWVSDTNPADEGTESWIYKKFYVERSAANHPYPAQQAMLGLEEVMLDDNPYLAPGEADEIRALYHSDPIGYAQNVEGRWVATSQKRKVFADLVAPAIHFIDGSIDVDGDTRELKAGWDVGNINHAAMIVEQKIFKGRTYYNVIDECVVIDGEMSTEDFTLMFLTKMEALDKFYGRVFKYTHWSDDTALNYYRPSIKGYDAMLVNNASNGRINLQAAEKPNGSVEESIKIIRRLLIDERLFVGKNCPYTQKALLNARRGKTKPIDDTPDKHIIDALRYVIYMEDMEHAAWNGAPPATSLRTDQSFGVFVRAT